MGLDSLCAVFFLTKVVAVLKAVDAFIWPEHAGDWFPLCFGGVYAWHALDDARFFHEGGIEFCWD